MTKTFNDRWVPLVGKEELVVFDCGFLGFALFDRLSEQGSFYVTRLRTDVRYQVVRVLSEGAHYQDALVKLGLDPHHPCQHPARLVSVLWRGVWYRYLTNVLDPQRLSAQEVCSLYRRRWRIEEAFLCTKRLLGLTYLWVGGSNGIQIQVYTTWLFYAVLTDLCAQVAALLDVAHERISEEMVYRGLYHYSRALQRGSTLSAAQYLADNAKLLGVLKNQRKRHRERQQEEANLWSQPAAQPDAQP